MFLEILEGTNRDPSEFLNALSEESHEEMVILKDIPLYSMCEHHMLPFSGKASIAYIPRNGKIIGLNTLATLVDCLSKRLQIQERLTKEIADGLPFIYSDQDKLKQVVFNLLSNAAKFTHAGQITVSARRQNEMLVLKVTDTGIGITEEALERIFEEFQQADDSTTRRYGGTGLGLSISRRLARLLGGDLTAASSEGVGSTFTLTIPLRYGETPTMPERYRH